MNKKLVLLTAAALTMATSAVAQKHVTGRVVDTSGQPVMGATVRVEGTKVHTVTDAEGRFTLPTVPESAKKLTVSYIGMTSQTVSVSGNVQVVMKDNELGEAVVVGYGSAKKVGTVVGSLKKVNGEVVENKPTTNVADALQGQVAGLSVLNNTGDVGEFGNISISIRGIGSMSADNTPLIVVDGSPSGTAILQMLGPSDIESITTLKDASATSIYGSRAANGVIYITTKKGRTGEKGQVSISQSIGWSQIARSIGNPMSADELLDFQLENGVIYPDNYIAYKQRGYNTDWQKYIFDNAAPMYQTDFTVRGGGDRTTYYVSASYLKQNGVTIGSDLKRTTFRTNLETKVNSWLRVGVNQAMAYSENQTNGYTYNGSNGLYSAPTVAASFPRYWGVMDNDRIFGSETWKSGGIASPKYAMNMQPSVSKNIVYQGNAFVEIAPISGLTIKSQLGLYATNSLSSYKLLPSGAAALGASNGTARRGLTQTSQWTMTNTAEYKWNVTPDHHLTFLLGHEGIKYSGESFRASVSGLQDDRLMLLSAGTTPGTPTETSAKYEYLSFFGRVDYDFKNRYYANFTVRNDASSRFGKNNRNATFLSGGLMWDAIQEEFMAPVRSWLTNLQVKFSVGSTGNSEIGNYGSLSLVGSTNYGGEQGYYYSQFPNADLGWEKQVQTNWGFTAGLFGKLTLDFNVYRRKTKDMLMSTPLPYTTGLGSMMKNIGEMTNRGVEIELSYDIVRTRDWYVNFRTTYSYNANKIDKLFYDLDEYPVKDALINYQVGKGITYYMPIFAGVDETDGAPMWYKVGHSGGVGYTYDPETMTKDESQIESLYQDTGKKRFAPHNGGFGLTVSWKGLTLTADFTYVLGKYMVNNDYYLNTASSTALQGMNMDRDALQMWKKPGDHALLPAFKYDSQFDTHLLENASFMRLKNLQLSYDLPKRWMQATKFFTGVRLNFTGRNIFTITKYKGVNPELDSNLSIGNHPETRQYTLGVEVQF